MNRILTISLLLIITYLQSGTAQVDRNEKEREWIRANRIKQKEQWDYRYEGDKPGKKGFLSSKMSFDKDGRVTEIINYLNNGSVINVSSYSFDPRGNQTEFIKYTGNKTKLSFKQKFVYDANGNKIVETGFNGAEEYKNTYQYNAQGKMVLIKYFLEDKLDETRSFRYSGRDVEVLITDPEGNLKFKLLNKLDDKGNILEMIKTDKAGVPVEKTVYTYNQKSQLTMEESSQKGVVTERLFYSYDSDGDLFEIWAEKGNSEKFLKNSNTYRPDGRLSEERWRSNPSAEYSYKRYTYDSKGQLQSTDSFFASYKYRVLNKFTYK